MLRFSVLFMLLFIFFSFCSPLYFIYFNELEAGLRPETVERPGVLSNYCFAVVEINVIRIFLSVIY